MPCIGVICPYDNSYQLFENCICSHEQGGSRNCDAPVAILKLMRDNDIDRKDAGISVSMLLECPRAVAIRATYPYYESIKSGWNKGRGTWVHAMIESERDPSPNFIKERRVKRALTVNGKSFVLTGKPDEINVARGILVDYKSKHSIPKRRDKAHEAQFNCYRWLLAHGTFMDNGEHCAIDIKGGGMHYLTWETQNMPFKKVNYDIWPIEQTEEFIRERALPLIEWKETGELPQCHPYVRGRWECDCSKLTQQLTERGISL